MSVNIEYTNIPGLVLIHPQVFSDERGFFLESYSQREYTKHGLNAHFIQDNHSKSEKGVLRGMHFQKINPQAKLVRVIRGSVYDVVIDLRSDSPTYGKWEGFFLSGENKTQLFVPRGFAHGFLTLEDDTEFLYKCDNYYDPNDEGGIAWNDSQLAIDWEKYLDAYNIKEVIVSKKDSILPNFKAICDQ
ncbi:MAG: dTDP-4-dehydrorhamnose 3,5-epimerase [Candidatus Gracilibacteria bacterium]